MKKNLIFYSLIWISLFGLFNLLTFIIPAWPNLEKYTASFWIGWGVAVAAFIIQLICSMATFFGKSAKKTFYNVAFLSVSYGGLVGVFVVSMFCIVVTPLPYWIAAIACSIALVINIVAICGSRMAIVLVNGLDKKVEKATSFVYDMREASESLLARAESDDARAICKNVRDAFKYSDPMSNDELRSIEDDIKLHFELLKRSFAGDGSEVEKESKELLILINERNNKCKRLK